MLRRWADTSILFLNWADICTERNAVYMELMKIKRGNSLAVNLLHSISYASVIGYIIMSAAWLISGMRISMIQCWSIWIICLTVIFCILGTISAVIDVRKNMELDRLAEHRLKLGYDDEYFNMLNAFIIIYHSRKIPYFLWKIKSAFKFTTSFHYINDI